MKIINYGHACFKIIDDGVSVIFDPYESGSVPGLELPKNIKANYLFISHEHLDHNAINKVELLPTLKKLNLTEIVLPHDDCGGAKRGLSVARVLRFSDYSICHMGDIGDVNAVLQCEELKNIDIVLCPINGYYTISAKDALYLKEKMGWKLLIPMHFFDSDKKTGYPDGNQIHVFKGLLNKSDYLLLGDYQLDINDSYFSFGNVIFLQRKEGNNNND